MCRRPISPVRLAIPLLKDRSTSCRRSIRMNMLDRKNTCNGLIAPGRATASRGKVPRLHPVWVVHSIDGDLGAGLKKPSPGPGSYEIAASDASQAPGRKGTYFSHGGSRFDNSFSGGRYTSPGPGQYVGQTNAFDQRTRRRSSHLGPARTGFKGDGRRARTGPEVLMVLVQEHMNQQMV